MNMNEQKYTKEIKLQIEEVHERIRDLNFGLGDLVNMLRNEEIDDKIKAAIEEQAWVIVEKINEISNKKYRKKS